MGVYYTARGQGFEPRLTGPEPVVLPLDDPRLSFVKTSDNKININVFYILSYKALAKLDH